MILLYYRKISFRSNTIFRKDRNKNGGGVLLAVHNSLQSVLLEGYNNNIEAIWCTLKFLNSKLIIGTIYRAPNVDDTYLKNVITNISNVCRDFSRCELVITGDFNFPGISWDIPYPKNSDRLCKEFVECIIENSFEQAVRCPTRSANILDFNRMPIFM